VGGLAIVSGDTTAFNKTVLWESVAGCRSLRQVVGLGLRVVVRVSQGLEGRLEHDCKGAAPERRSLHSPQTDMCPNLST